MATFAVLLVLLPAAGFGQARDAAAKESITVSVVEVPVTVVDHDGNPVRGLTTANFQLFDEGKNRPITGIDAIDFASTQATSAISPMNPAARRNFLILFDLTFSSPGTITRAQDAARNFVSKSVARRDRVAVATIDAQKGFRLLSAFTTDRKLVADAISNPQTFKGSDPLQIAGTIPWAEQSTVSGSSGGSGRGGVDAVAEYNEMIHRAGVVNDQYNRQQIEREVSLLGGLAKTLRSVPGQKHVILLTEGFDPRLVQGRDAGINVDQVRENDAIEHGRIWDVDSDARFGSASAMTIVDQMAQLFRRSDVVLHAVDIKGVRGSSDVTDSGRSNSNEGLYILANPTGGTVLKNVNNIGTDFDRFLKQQEVVYVLAFQAPSSEPGKFHNLKVKLVNVPGGARVGARAGYYEAGRETAPERSLSTAEIVVNDIPQDAIRFAPLIAPFPTTGQNAQVPVVLEINGPDLLQNVTGNSVSAEVFVYAFDEQGLVRDSLYQRIGLDLAKVGAQLKSSGVKFYGVMSLPPGSYAVKTLVRVAETDRKGFARTDLVVPQAGAVAVSEPFFFETPGKWLMIKGVSHDSTKAAYPFEVNGDMFIPRAAVRVKNGEPNKFAVFVQNASPDDLTVETNPAAKIVSRFKSANGTKFVLQLDGAVATASAMSVTVRSKSGTPQQVSIPIQVE